MSDDELDAEPLDKKTRTVHVFECSECHCDNLWQRDRSGGFGCHNCGYEGHESSMPSRKGVKIDDVAAAVKHLKSNIRETQLWLSTNETDIILEAIDEAFADVVEKEGDEL